MWFSNATCTFKQKSVLHHVCLLLLKTNINKFKVAECSGVVPEDHTRTTSLLFDF